MKLFEWETQYSVDIRQIDNEHKYLIGLLNELLNAMNQGRGKDILGYLFEELLDYTKYHFSTEERLMSIHGYPDYTHHKKEHNELTKQVLTIKEQFDNGQTNISIVTYNFLKEWLKKHILGTDMKFGPFLKSKGVN